MQFYKATYIGFIDLSRIEVSSDVTSWPLASAAKSDSSAQSLCSLGQSFISTNGFKFTRLWDLWRQKKDTYFKT